MSRCKFWVSSVVVLVASAVCVAEGLPRATPESQGIASDDLRAFIEALDREIDGMHGVMVVRHGSVVAEGWWAPYDAETTHVLYSLSKSFTSTAVGLAIAEGKLRITDPVLKFFPDEAPAEPSAFLRAMRVKDLLRMGTGHQTEPDLRGNEPGSPTYNWTWVKKFLHHPVAFKPGSHFLYNSPATYMQSAIVQKVTGQTVLDYLKPRLFDPLGIEGQTWEMSPEGISTGSYGLMIRTEDIARFGQLYLQKGQWQGRQLIPSEWVEQATGLQIANGSSPNSDWDQGYGYQFWRSRHGYRGDGAFGQYCIVVPELDAVVAIHSGVSDMQAVMNVVWDRLLPAMRYGSLPDDAAAHERLTATLTGLTMAMPKPADGVLASAGAAGRWYEMDENALGVRAVMLDVFGNGAPQLLVRTEAGEVRTSIGQGEWKEGRGGFAAGMNRFLSVPENPLLAAAGAWTAANRYTLKIVASQTPYYATLALDFEGDRVKITTNYNVAFGPRQGPTMTGTASR